MNKLKSVEEIAQQYVNFENVDLDFSQAKGLVEMMYSDRQHIAEVLCEALEERWGQDGGPALVEVASETQRPILNELKSLIKDILLGGSEVK